MARRGKVWRFSVPMASGVVLRDRRLKQREGLLVQLIEGAREGWGEISPLPGFSVESLDQAQQALLAWLDLWQGGEQCPPLPPEPAVAFGLSCAQLELEGGLAPCPHPRTVPLCNGDPDALILTLAAMPSPRVAKVKVGEYEAVRDGMMVNLLLEAVAGLRLRLDANRRWNALKAEQFAKYVRPEWRSRIDFIEEPCQTPALSLAFSRETGIAIAWDESLREPDFVIRPEAGLRAIIIKPTLTGSIQRVIHQVEAAQRAGLMAVISCSLESSFGLTLLARLAAWLTPGTPPGLDTLNLMDAQIVRPWTGSTLPCWSLDSLEVIR